MATYPAFEGGLLAWHQRYIALFAGSRDTLDDSTPTVISDFHSISSKSSHESLSSQASTGETPVLKQKSERSPSISLPVSLPLSFPARSDSSHEKEVVFSPPKLAVDTRPPLVNWSSKPSRDITEHLFVPPAITPRSLATYESIHQQAHVDPPYPTHRLPTVMPSVSDLSTYAASSVSADRPAAYGILASKSLYQPVNRIDFGDFTLINGVCQFVLPFVLRIEPSPPNTFGLSHITEGRLCLLHCDQMVIFPEDSPFVDKKGRRFIWPRSKNPTDRAMFRFPSGSTVSLRVASHSFFSTSNRPSYMEVPIELP